MDRHQLTHARDSHNHESKHNRRTSHRHHHRHREPLADLQNDARRRPIQENNAAPSPISRLNNPLSEEPDYVRRWLAQTEDSGKENQTLQADAHFTNLNSVVDNRSHNKHDKEARPKHRSANTNGTKLSTARKQHNSSSDSSILETPILPRIHSTKNEHYAQRKEVDDKVPSDRNKKKRARSSSSESSIPSLRKETFGKRPRHKTREDRYEPKKDKVDKEQGEEKRPSKKRISKTDRNKATKKAGEDLMRNFTSKSIGQERLTMRPPQGLGLFNNGRASSPAKRRGIPNLAFSEMDFLQHSYRHAPAENTQNSKSRTKSREKEKRKTVRAQQEIAEFFQPNRSVLQEIGPNRDPQFSKYRQEKEPIYDWHDDTNSKDVNQHQSSLHPREEYFKTRLDSRVLESHSARIPPSYQAPVPIRTPRPPTSVSKQSGDATSYISWSESQRTPASKSNRRMSSSNIRPESPTPDYIQRSIDKTGIFKNTGIRETQRPRSSEKSASTRYRSIGDTQNAGSASMPSHESEEMVLDTPAPQSSVHVPRTTRDKHSITIYENLPKARPLSPTKRAVNRKSPTSNDSQSQHSHVLVQHLDPRVGWHQNTDNCSQTPVETQTQPQTRELTATDRAAIAKDARIRPATTQPVARADKKGSRKNRASSEPRISKPDASTLRINNVLAAGDSAKIATESELHSRTGPMPISNRSPHDRPEEAPANASFLENVDRGFEAVSVPQDQQASSLLQHSTDFRLQTPASMGANAGPEYQRAECISHLGLSVREPSTINRRFSPSLPYSTSFRLVPIMDPDPLFIRQIDERNRGDDLRFRDRVLTHQQQVTSQYAHNQDSYRTNDDVDMEHREEDMFDEHGEEYHDLEDSYFDQLLHQPYQSYDNVPTYEAERAEISSFQRSWRPDLTPIREQSDEYEQSYLEDHDWEMEEAPHANQHSYTTQAQPQVDVYSRENTESNFHFRGMVDVDERNEDEHMAGFWRPQARY